MSGFPRAAALAVGRGSRSITVIIVEDFGPFRDIYRMLLSDDPLTHVVVLGEDNGQEYHAAAKASGASAYLPKEHTVHLLGSLIYGFVAQPVC